MNLTMKRCPKCAGQLELKNIDNRKRLQCSNKSCNYIFWNNPIPVVGMIVETQKGIVLAHNKLAPAGIFSIITGFLEMGENPLDAAARETKEELGLEATQINIIGLFPFSRAGQIIIAYHIIANGDIKLNEELDDYKIVQKNELRGYSKSGTFEVQEWLDKLNVIE